MTKSIVRTKEEWEQIFNDPDFDEEAFEREYFPEGSYEEALEKGLVFKSDGKGNWIQVKPKKKAARKTEPASRVLAESLDGRIIENPAFAAK